jgi:hypothetical protein
LIECKKAFSEKELKGEIMDKYSIWGIPLGLLFIVFCFLIVLIVMLFIIKKSKREK